LIFVPTTDSFLQTTFGATGASYGAGVTTGLSPANAAGASSAPRTQGAGHRLQRGIVISQCPDARMMAPPARMINATAAKSDARRRVRSGHPLAQPAIGTGSSGMP
jgi:hypothetical protein